MKKHFSFSAKSAFLTHILVAALTMTMLILPSQTMADESETDSKPTAYAMYKNFKLTFKYGIKPDYKYLYDVDTTTVDTPEWYFYLRNKGYAAATVKIIEFDPSFANVHPISCYRWFHDFTELYTVKGLEYLNTEKVTNMALMFANCGNLTELDLSHFNTSNVTEMASMFYECTGLTTLNLTSFNTSNVTGMEYMFYDCKGLTTLDLTSFNTSKVSNMERMFAYCSNLATVYASDAFSTDRVTTGNDMFINCEKIQAHGGYDETNIGSSRANFTKQWGYFKTYYKVGDTKHEFYGIAPLSVDNLEITDGADFTTYSTFTATQAQYTRTMPSNWGTLCLPFAIDAEAVEDCKFFGLSSVTNDKIELTQLTGTITSGTPILVYSTTKDLNITASNTPIVKAAATGETVDGWQLTGSFTEANVDDNDYIISKNKFWLASQLKTAATGTTTVKSKAMRAWITPRDDTAPKASALAISTGETTAIDALDALENNKAEIYDIQGRRVTELHKGINIVKTGNSVKKIIVK